MNVVVEGEDAPQQNLTEEATICLHLQDDECDSITVTSASAEKLNSIVVRAKLEPPTDCNIIANTSIMSHMWRDYYNST